MEWVPVREWLNELPRADQKTIGRDIAKVQFGWPVGLRCAGWRSVGIEIDASKPVRGAGVVRILRGHVDRAACLHQENAEDRAG